MVFASLLLRVSEKPVQLGIDPVDDLTEMFLVFGEVLIVSFEYQESAQFVRFDPCLVALIQSFEVIKSD